MVAKSERKITAVIAILRQVLEGGGIRAVTAKEVSGYSTMPTMDLLNELEKDGVLEKSVIPNPISPKMQPGFFYTPGSKLSADYIKELEAFKEARSSNSNSSSPGDPASPRIPDPSFYGLSKSRMLKHVQTIRLVEKYGRLSVGQLHELIPGRVRQSHSKRLEALRSLGWLDRKNNVPGFHPGEYLYFVAANAPLSDLPDIDAEMVDQLRLLKIQEPIEQPVARRRVERCRKPLDGGTQQSKAIATSLPPFNPNWSTEAQERWLRIAEKLLVS